MRARGECLVALLVLSRSVVAAPAGPPGRAVPVGTVIEGLDEQGRAARFRVDGIEPDPDDPGHELVLYRVSTQAPGGGFVPYCPPDRDGRSRAIPVAGSWDRSGAWSAAAGALTFACTSGAIGKCVRFGYPPWKRAAGRSLREFHLACVRMMRADYCGDGRSHTRDGTPIEIYDRIGIQRRLPPGSARPAELEAAWSPDGAAYLHVPRWSDRAAEIVAECPDKLASRTTLAGRPAPSTAEILRRWPDALIFNDRIAPGRPPAPAPR